MFNYDKLAAAIEQSGKSKTYLCKKLGRPYYYLRDILRQHNTVPDEYQQILADELGVTVAWLNDEEELPENKKSPVQADSPDGELENLIQRLLRLPPEQRKLVSDLVDNLAK